MDGGSDNGCGQPDFGHRPNLMKQLMVRFGLWLAQRGGWTPEVCSRVHADTDSELFKSACKFRDQIENSFAGASGEFKRNQALRAMLNSHPQASERDCALAIELAVRKEQ